MATPFAPEPPAERDNGLGADRYARLRRVDTRECDLLLEEMTSAGIACYTAIPADDAVQRREVYVDDTRLNEANAAADRAHRRFVGRRVAIDPDEVDNRFAELVGSFDGPSDVPDPPPPPPATRPVIDTPQPWRPPDGDWLADPPDDDDEDEEFVPPPPEPLPKPTRKVVIGILLVIAGSVSLFAPASMPVDSTAALVLGVVLIAGGIGWLVAQLRDRREDPFDDGSRV